MLIIVIALCFDFSLGCSPRINQTLFNETKAFFSNGSTWNGWDPPPGDDSWRLWIQKWGTPNNSNFDSTEEGRGPESGWPQYFKGLGKGIDGVPPPPWAYVPFGYGKPEFCFQQPAKGNCNENITRWGFNPTKNKCQVFVYSGCGANQNNFRDEGSCNETCVAVTIPSSDCESKIDSQELMFD